MDKSREQFEAWLKSTGQNPPYATKRGYWEIWKASRDNIEINLPKPKQGYLPGDYHIGYDSGAECEWENTVEKLTRLGLKVAE